MNHATKVNKKEMLIVRIEPNILEQLIQRALTGGYTLKKFSVDVPNMNEYVNDVLAQHIASEPLTKQVTVQRKATAEA